MTDASDQVQTVASVMEEQTTATKELSRGVTTIADKAQINKDEAEVVQLSNDWRRQRISDSACN